MPVEMIDQDLCANWILRLLVMGLVALGEMLKKLTPTSPQLEITPEFFIILYTTEMGSQRLVALFQNDPEISSHKLQISGSPVLYHEARPSLLGSLT